MNKKRLSLAILVALFLYLSYAWLKVPDEPLFKWQTYSKIYYDDEGKVLRLSLAKDERYRLWVPYEKIPTSLIDATILYEDRYYFSHGGVNIPALWKAFIATYFTSERRIGASTITMQVARAAFNLKSNTLTGKVKQIFYALWLEQHYSKKEILEFYFNAVSYGGNIEGIEAASQIYFHKTAIKLNLPEVLALAVIPQNPFKRNPTSSKGYAFMEKARAFLYDKYKNLYLNKTQTADQNGLMEFKLKVYESRQLPFYAPHFTTHLEKELYYDSGAIQTTLNLSKQNRVQRRIREWINKNQRKGIYNAAALLIDHRTMQIKAWVGSANFYNKKILGQVDAITSKRSPGSTLKPFVYALALDQSLIHPNTLLKDAPYRFGAYTPENYDKQFFGPLTATQALVSSRNVPAVRLSSQLSKPSLYEFLQRCDIANMKAEEHYGMSIALGGMETTMLELGKLYAMLANKGKLKDLSFLAAKKEEKALEMLTPESAWLTLDMLKHNPSPKERTFLGKTTSKEHFAWKTGTSYAFRDAWSVGVSKDYVLVVWVGNFDGSSNNSFVGREAAAPLFFNILKELDAKSALHNRLDPKAEQLNLSLVDICTQTGTLPSRLCPEVSKSWFIPGVSPITNSSIYREIPINIKSGKRACSHKEGISKLEVFEFWPSDLKRIFALAGITKKSPPPYEQSCADFKATAYNSNPEIQSPAKGIVYTIEKNNLHSMKIPFKVILDADSHKAFWFVNKDYVGSVNGNQILFWKAKLGTFTIRVVDEKGLSSSRIIDVKLAY